MSLLSSFVADHLLKALEDEFIAREPALQEALLDEAKVLGDKLQSWIAEKINGKAPA